MERRAVLQRLFREARPYMPRLLVSLVLAAIAGTGLVAFAPAFDLLINGVINNPKHDFVLLWEIIGGVFVINLIANTAAYFSAYFTAWSGQRLIADLRVQLLDRALKLPSLSFDRWRPGELLARSTNDLLLMGDAVSVALPQLVQVVVTFFVSLAYMFYTDWILTCVLLVIAPIISIAVGRFNNAISARSHQAQGRIAELTSNLSEVLHAQRVVKAFHRESYETTRFTTSTESFFQASLRVTQLMQLQIPVVGMMIVMTLLIIVFLSAREVSLGRMDAGSVFRFWTLVSLSINPINRIASYLGDISRGLIGAARVYEVLDLDIEPIDATPYRPTASRLPAPLADVPAPMLPHPRGELVFTAVGFRYPGTTAPVLDNFSLHIPAGSVVALVGPSGAGKTTVAQLVPRFYPIDAGAISFDGVDLTQMSLAELRGLIGIVPQESQLFRATVAENIRYGRLDATDADVHAAAADANAEEFIRDLPAGYDTLIGEGGVRLSGGQRQRLAIARAIVRDPRVLILDEATSALDSHSEARIEAAFDRVLAGRTTIIIAHRLSTIRRADRIVYIEQGVIRESGTHTDLLESGGAYADLVAAQLR